MCGSRSGLHHNNGSSKLYLSVLRLGVKGEHRCADGDPGTEGWRGVMEARTSRRSSLALLFWPTKRSAYLSNTTIIHENLVVLSLVAVDVSSSHAESRMTELEMSTSSKQVPSPLALFRFLRQTSDSKHDLAAKQAARPVLMERAAEGPMMWEGVGKNGRSFLPFSFHAS